MKKATLFVGAFLLLLSAVPTYAQTIKGKASRANMKSSTVLAISDPQNNASVSSPLNISGKASKNTEISINVKAIFTNGHQDLGTFVAISNSNGIWQTTPINLWAPEDAKNLRYEITASEPSDSKSTIGGMEKSKPKKIVVTPNKNIQMISRVEMTDKNIQALNPQIKLKPKITELTLKPTPSLSNNVNTNINIDETTRIKFPVENSGFTDIPVVIEGTTKPNSEVQVAILTSYQENGKPIATRNKLKLSSDNNGKWGAVKMYSIKVDKADDKVTHEITAIRLEGENEKGNKATRTIYSKPKEKTSWDPNANKPIKLKVTLLEIQCAVSKDDDKIDDYGITQHVKYKANGRVKNPISTDIQKFSNHKKCKPGDENSYWEGSTALICGNRDRQIHVQESSVTDRRSPNINNSIIFEITASEANDKNAEFTIDTWIKEYSSTTLSNIFGNEDYDNVLNKDPRKMRVAIHDVLAVLKGTKALRATNKYFDGDVSQSLKFDNFDNASLPLRKVSYSGKTILEGPIRGRMRNAHNNRKAFVWMRFELVD